MKDEVSLPWKKSDRSEEHSKRGRVLRYYRGLMFGQVSGPVGGGFFSNYGVYRDDVLMKKDDSSERFRLM